MTTSERSEAYRWLVRLKKDLDVVNEAAKRGMQEEGPSLENELLHHRKYFWLFNEWHLKRAVIELFEGDKRALAPILRRVDRTTDGFTHENKKLRFSEILDFIEDIQVTHKWDPNNPNQSALRKAYRNLLEDHTKNLTGVLASAFTALSDFVPNSEEIEEEEGGLRRQIGESESAEYSVTYLSLVRLEKDLARMKAEVSKDGDSSGISLESDVIEFRTRTILPSSWYVQEHHIDGLRGLRYVLKKRLKAMDSQSTGVFIQGEAHRYSDLLKLMDKLDNGLRIDYRNPDRSVMKKAIEKLVERIDTTVALSAALRENLRPLTNNHRQIERAESPVSDGEELDNAFGGLEFTGND